MSKELESYWAIYPELWTKPGAKEAFSAGWKSAIEAAAKRMESYCGVNGKCASYPEIIADVRALAAEEK